MNLLTRAQFAKLLDVAQGPVVSIYMPTHRTGSEADPRQFKVALADAEERLLATGMRRPDVRDLLAPARALLDDSAFWQRQSDGLACFIGSNVFESFRLPLAFKNQVVVGNRFHVTPLVPLVTLDGRFFVLALSQKSVRLLLGTRFAVDAIDMNGVPTSLAELLAEHDRDEVLNLHTRPNAQGARGEATFHGHGVGIDTKKSDLRTFFQRLDRELRVFLRDERAPLVLAGVDYLLPIYREVSTYPNVVEEAILGSPDRFSDQELHARAWEIVRPLFEKAHRTAREQYEQLAGTGRTSADVREIVPAAYRGEIETLFLAEDGPRWGTFDPDAGLIEEHETPRNGDEDLINLAAVHALKRGRSVYLARAEEMPARGVMAATFMLPLRKI
jgi:hypothetical protein